MDIVNCTNCGGIYIKNPVRDCCEKCYAEEEKKFEMVAKFLRKRENREATMAMIVEATEVDEALLQKWIRKGRLQIAQFPNLGYSCDKCGNIIRAGRLCEPCANGLKDELDQYEREEEQKSQQTRVFHSRKK